MNISNFLTYIFFKVQDSTGLDALTASSTLSDADAQATATGLAAIIFGFLGILMLPFIIVIILMIVGSWKINTKAGKPGWACLVPIYGQLVTLEIINRQWWWLLIPIINIFVINIDLAKSFGKSTGFAIGLIFLPFIFYPILGFGKAEYTRIER